jgi:protein-S-isoprenylcysteine O-methyltransferase Ste14
MDSGDDVGMGARTSGWLLVGLQFTLLIALVLVPRRTTSIPWMALGAVLAILGLAAAVAAMLRLGDALTPTPVPRDSAALRTDGVYSRVRHPIYSGLLLTACGFTVAIGSWWTVAILVALAIFFGLKSRWEDSLLHAAHGAQWEDWAARTGRLLPRFHTPAS